MSFGNMAKMAQQMQAEMARVQAELDALSVEGTAGGGAVTATVSGHGQVISVSDQGDEVVVKVDDNVRLRMVKSSIARNLTKEEALAAASRRASLSGARNT